LLRIPVAQRAEVMCAMCVKDVYKSGRLMNAKRVSLLITLTGCIEIPFFILFQHHIKCSAVVDNGSLYRIILAFRYPYLFACGQYFSVMINIGRGEQL